MAADCLVMLVSIYRHILGHEFDATRITRGRSKGVELTELSLDVEIETVNGDVLRAADIERSRPIVAALERTERLVKEVGEIYTSLYRGEGIVA